MTEASKQAVANLRDLSHFQWYVVPLLVLVVYVYAVEIERRNWSMVLAGLALWGMDWFNEIVNSLILHFTGRSALWTVPADSAYIILVGLNIEITFMFAIMGIVLVKMLPKDRDMKILGIPNRWFFVVVNSLLCVAVEVVLNFWDALIWEYWFWNWPHVWLIVIFGYGTFMVAAFKVYDMEKLSSKIKTVAAIFSLDTAMLVVFGVLGWI